MGTRENRLTEAVLTSTHYLCLRAKIRKNIYPCKPQFYYIKVGCKGVLVTRSCFRDFVRPQKMARGLNFRNYEGSHYICCENKGVDRLRGYHEAGLRLCFRICNKQIFS